MCRSTASASAVHRRTNFAQRHGDTATHTPRRPGDERYTPFQRIEVGLGFGNSLRKILSGRSHHSLPQDWCLFINGCSFIVKACFVNRRSFIVAKLMSPRTRLK